MCYLFTDKCLSLFFFVLFEVLLGRNRCISYIKLMFFSEKYFITTLFVRWRIAEVVEVAGVAGISVCVWLAEALRIWRCDSAAKDIVSSSLSFKIYL